MKVLFIGEFSGVFHELIPALQKKGIETFLISDGDGFKGLDNDFSIRLKNNKNLFERVLNLLLLPFGLNGIFSFIKIWPQLKLVTKGFDIVQFNNDSPLPGYSFWGNYCFVKYLSRHNKKLYLSAWGNDYYLNKYLYEVIKHPSLINYFANKKINNVFNLHYRKIITDTIIKQVRAIMPGMYWYREAYKWNPKTTNIVPVACLPERIGYPLNIDPNKPIVIFHGWQKGREKGKGNFIMDRVVKKVLEKYGEDKIDYRIVSGVPFNEYMKLFKECHIFLDQVFADDKGMNGMFGMAAGKVVFSGFMPEALACYPGYDGKEIGIRTYNDEDYIFKRLCDLIDNPLKMEEISKNAIEFVKKYHLNDVVAEKYLEIWNK